ncbi:MAG: hypothetical protein A2719_05315 [Candidatus Ryanbacteria bacterium RIFCSPHIGHO2_01_FULL_45_22]|uniref:Toxin YoeB n=1 Tax=Candidatus Ryanbacteria bacterium RIFCSPHIGHO2_01_FULL_45_22 TaxID=1802114 RepID=A0A1G2G3D8_9BACT|nr:MAG: hypothetical protein A2719_05315 [Candidatus Ryanbacteria bacterium RIFCSPHIGHO2_01_FULL_45_22]
MQILPLSKRLLTYLVSHGIKGKFEKQKNLFETSPFYPSLHTEVLEPHHLHIYSFRITQKYRAVFIYRGSNRVEIIDINNHYQ